MQKQANIGGTLSKVMKGIKAKDPRVLKRLAMMAGGAGAAGLAGYQLGNEVNENKLQKLLSQKNQTEAALQNLFQYLQQGYGM